LRVIGLGRFGLGGGGAAERKSDVRGFAVHVSAARAAGAEAVVVTGASRSSEHLKVFLAALDELIQAAAQWGVSLYVANRTGTCIEQMDDLRAVFTSDRYADLRLLLDAGEFYQSAVNPRDVWAEFGQQTACVVISDRRGGHKVPLGVGRVNVSGLLADVVRDRYTGWLVMDPLGATGTSWLEGLRRDLSFVRDRCGAV